MKSKKTATKWDSNRKETEKKKLSFDLTNRIEWEMKITKNNKTI